MGVTMVGTVAVEPVVNIGCIYFSVVVFFSFEYSFSPSSSIGVSVYLGFETVYGLNEFL